MQLTSGRTADSRVSLRSPSKRTGVRWSRFPPLSPPRTPPGVVAGGPESSLPEGDVTVDVHWSSLNYKDGLAVTGKGRIVRSFPMVCGIDLAGTVRSSDSADWSAGDEVVVTGWGLSGDASLVGTRRANGCGPSGCNGALTGSPCARRWRSGPAA